MPTFLAVEDKVSVNFDLVRGAIASLVLVCKKVAVPGRVIHHEVVLEGSLGV